jgi:Second Messenger Oligonucleotide or Dinucleotide Synthetase domain
MPYTVAVSFDRFFEAINLSGDHREAANIRRDDVVATLSNSFTIVESFSTGSIPKFTALKGHADLDVVVALHWGKHTNSKTPTQVLQSVRDALSAWRTGARKNGQAVTLHYKTWPNVDIVPVSRVLNEDGSVAHYEVPNSNNDTWIKSRPKEHAAQIESKSTECGFNFRRIIKYVKHWNRIHSDYLQSYHIEVLAIKIFSSNVDDTNWNVMKFFQEAKTLVQSPLYYDSGYVDDYLTASDRGEVVKRLSVAYDLSNSAWYQTYGTNDNHKSAIEKWRQLFGDDFPAYG